ncbi:hypothetical protein ATORI0001_0719 [Lancefieldella rimae ATCC 49626]|uniref:Uncharacterized protein n=1 Tax=Lancefieldella rimae (strain ATCC 49626 / DSM 7090 / CCUG 31168 / NBRC 15546 / VPI D140H-11A) TaxID=553184 RepID=B9CL06_LANR4|nr:hypothetical protein ATORI0001_0719 [Lancefieldella rimae ATCC 49626]
MVNRMPDLRRPLTREELCGRFSPTNSSRYLTQYISRCVL